jgi:hypothetical protein
MQDIGLDLDKKSTTIFNNWLNAWNANYFPLDQHQFSPSLPSQQNLEVQVKNRRSFLEVFKFLEVSEIVLSLSKVNKNFYSLTWEKELWNFLLVRDFSIVKQDLEVDELKEAYVTCFYDFCIECKKKPSNEKFNRCPLLKKTLCRDCLMMKKFHTFDKTDIWRIYGIKSDLVKVAWWTSDGINRITYRVLFESGLMMFRKEQKQKVLDFRVLGC